MRASHSSWVAYRWAGISGGRSSSHAAVGGVELDDLELERRRRLLEVDLARGMQRAAAADVHLQPVRAHRRHVLEQHDPVVARCASPPPAARPRSRGPRSRVSSRWRWQNAASRTAARSISDAHARRVPFDHRRRDVASLGPGRHEVVVRAHVAQLVGDRADDRHVLLVDRGVDHHRRVDPRLGAPPRRDGVLAPHEQAAQTVQVLSWKALSRHAVSAASRTSSGWNGLTPSIRKSSGKPYSAPHAKRHA